MARVIQEHLKKPLANELLFGDLTRGGHVNVTVSKDNEIAIEVVSETAKVWFWRATRAFNKNNKTTHHRGHREKISIINCALGAVNKEKLCDLCVLCGEKPLVFDCNDRCTGVSRAVTVEGYLAR